MESLLQQTNHMLFQLNHQIESLVQSQDEIIFEELRIKLENLLKIYTLIVIIWVIMSLKNHFKEELHQK